MVGLSVLGDVLVQPNAYMLDKANGANVLTITLCPTVRTSSTTSWASLPTCRPCRIFAGR
jgi:hypothetical protein